VAVGGTAAFNAGANAITLATGSNDFGGPVSLANSGANNVALTDATALVLGPSNVGSGLLTITAGGPITQGGALVQAPGAGAASFVAGANAIFLSNPGNNFTGAVALSNSGPGASSSTTRTGSSSAQPTSVPDR
jgi:hypothetical protein